MAEHLHPQFIHDLLSHELRDVVLPVAYGGADHQGAQVQRREHRHPAHVPDPDVSVDRDFHKVRTGQIGGRGHQQQNDGRRHGAPVRSHIAQQPAHQPRIIGLAEDLVFLEMCTHRTGASRSAASSSSSSNCFWYRSA